MHVVDVVRRDSQVMDRARVLRLIDGDIEGRPVQERLDDAPIVESSSTDERRASAPRGSEV